MESDAGSSPEAARATLGELDTMRERIAHRVAAPWWYRTGMAVSTACLFLGMGVLVGRPEPGSGAEAASTLIIVLGACVAPIALLWALKRSTGVSIDRYTRGMTGWYVCMFVLLGAAFVLQAFLNAPFALAGAGVVAFVVTLVNEHRLDASLRARVRAGR